MYFEVLRKRKKLLYALICGYDIFSFIAENITFLKSLLKHRKTTCSVPNQTKIGATSKYSTIGFLRYIFVS